MGEALTLHPESSCRTVTGIEVEAARPRPGVLVLTYTVSGRMGGVALPAPAAPARADDLWRRTCFEAFVAAPSGAGYYEFNFAPSTAWAAYAFSGYRAGKTNVGDLAAPAIEVATGPSSFTLRATLDLSGLSGLIPGGPWRVGLSAVIEEALGRISYWALAHPPGRADFHADCNLALPLSPTPAEA
jgi:hypothetical protein